MGATAIAITGITLRNRMVKGEMRVEVVVHTAEDGERWISHSESLAMLEHGMVDTMVTANGIRARPSRRCPLIGKAAAKRFEDAEIAAGNMKPREQWGDTWRGKAWKAAHKKVARKKR